MSKTLGGSRSEFTPGERIRQIGCCEHLVRRDSAPQHRRAHVKIARLLLLAGFRRGRGKHPRVSLRARRDPNGNPLAVRVPFWKLSSVQPCCLNKYFSRARSRCCLSTSASRKIRVTPRMTSGTWFQCTKAFSRLAKNGSLERPPPTRKENPSLFLAVPHPFCGGQSRHH